MNSTKILCDRFNVRLATFYESGNFVRPASTSFFPFFPFLLSFFFLTDETEGTCQILPAIRSYVITSSASRSPRFRVRIERFYYDVDYLRSGSNSTDEQRTYIGGRHLFLLANETRDQKELLFLFVRPKYERILSSSKKSIFRCRSGEIIDLFDSPYIKSN